MPNKKSNTNSVTDFERDGYLVLRNVISREICTFGVTHFQLIKTAGYMRKGDQLVSTCWSGYGLPFAETILSLLVKTASDIVGDTLLPTYSFSRVYLPGAEMIEHLDRPSCEISGSLTLGYSTPEPWSLFMKNKDQETLDIKLDSGDMLLYKGTERPHWREKWTVEPGNWQIQIFLHFVRSNGKHKDMAYDGRPCLAAEKTTPVQRL